MSGRLRSKLKGGSHEKYTLNFDGSYNNQKNTAGAGCIIRNSQGELVVAAAYNLSEEFSEYCNVAIAEAAALRNGLKLANDFNIKLDLIKGDSQEVINRVDVALGCNTTSSRRPSIKHYKGSKKLLSEIIQQIVGMLDRSHQIEHINREANQVADKLASLGSSKLPSGHKLFSSNDDDLPPQVAKLIKKEKSRSRSEEQDAEEGINMVENIGMLVRDELIKQTNGILDHFQKMAVLESRELDTTYNADLPPQKTCGLHMGEDELLEGKVCKKCDELQSKLIEREKRIAELDVEVKILVQKNLMLERKEEDLLGSVVIMNNELRRMHNKMTEATKRDKNESMASVVLCIFGFLIYSLYI